MYKFATFFAMGQRIALNSSLPCKAIHASIQNLVKFVHEFSLVVQ